MTRVSDSWNLAAGNLSLEAGEVHVWRACLDQSAAVRQRLEATLAADEQKRALALRRRQDGQDFIVARGVLRAVLSRYVNAPPEQLRFVYNAHGKPFLADAGIKSPLYDALHFNVSHAHRLAVYAVARGRRVGVDIEYVHVPVDTEQLARQFFSRHEIAALQELPPSLRREAFFHCWTRKEAYLKARGEGLSMPLDEFYVPLTVDGTITTLSTASDANEAACWSVQELNCESDYVAALVIEGPNRRPKLWQWSDSALKAPGVAVCRQEGGFISEIASQGHI